MSATFGMSQLIVACIYINNNISPSYNVYNNDQQENNQNTK